MKKMYVITNGDNPVVVCKTEPEAKKYIEEIKETRCYQLSEYELSYISVPVYTPPKPYTLSFCSRFGYAIEFSTTIQNKLIDLKQKDEEKYDELIEEIHDKYGTMIDDYGSDAISFYRWAFSEGEEEYYDDDDANSDRFPAGLKAAAEEIIGIVNTYIE